MKFRNIDLVNSLIPVCTVINEWSYENCICPQCCAHSSGNKLSNEDSAADILLKLTDACILLEKLSPEYIRRFEDYEIDFEDLMDTIIYTLQDTEVVLDNFGLINEHIEELLEMCEAEIEQYLLMTHPADHNDLSLFAVEWNGGDDIEPRIVCRTTAQSAGSGL